MKNQILTIAAILVVIVFVAACLGFLALSNSPAHALGIPQMAFLIENRVEGAGDCSADGARGDVIAKRDWYCDPLRNNSQAPAEVSASNSQNNTSSAPDLNDSSTMQVINPPVEVTPLPPTQKVELPVVTETPKIDVTTIPPTQKPDDTSTPEPDPTQVCKNKNWNKDGTPDCNAGKGNG